MLENTLFSFFIFHFKYSYLQLKSIITIPMNQQPILQIKIHIYKHIKDKLIFFKYRYTQYLCWAFFISI